MEISFESSRYPLLEMISENLLCAAEFHRNMASLHGVIVRNETKDGKVPGGDRHIFLEGVDEGGKAIQEDGLEGDSVGAIDAGPQSSSGAKEPGQGVSGSSKGHQTQQEKLDQSKKRQVPMKRSSTAGRSGGRPVILVNRVFR